MLVDRVTAAGNGARGIDVQQGVTDLTLVRSQVTGNLSEGVYVADRTHAMIAHNRITGNCTGVMLLDEGSGIAQLRIQYNAVTTNNCYCPDDDEGEPSMSGNGIVLAGASATTVTHNLITGNHPFDVFSDGSGTHNQFSGNLRGTSTMPGICGGG